MSGLGNGSIVRYHGPGVLAEVTSAASGTPIPADSDSLILAMKGGQPMAPKLKHEFPRAAMNVEVKRGQRGEEIPRPYLVPGRKSRFFGRSGAFIGVRKTAGNERSAA